jgi:hypothetical protein
MKNTGISITHPVEITRCHFMIGNPYMLTSSEVNSIKKEMVVLLVFVNVSLYKQKKGSTFIVSHESDSLYKNLTT